MTSVISNIMKVRKKADSHKEVREAASSQKGVREAADSQKRDPRYKKFGNLWTKIYR